MAAILIASFEESGRSKAESLFHRVCDTTAELKGCPPPETLSLPGCLIARFAASDRTEGGIVDPPGGRYVYAQAGWLIASDGQLPLSQQTDDLFEATGEKILDHLQGQYSLAIVDRRSGKTFIGLDRLAIYPSYVYAVDGIAWFANWPLPLAKVLGVGLDLDAVRSLFACRVPNCPHSLFENVRRLGSGEYAWLEGGKCDVLRNWIPYCDPRAYGSISEAAEAGASILRNVGGKMQSIWKQPLLDLTSGLDSRLVVAAFAEDMSRPLQLAVNGPADNIDVLVAREVAEKFGWSLLHFEVKNEDPQERWERFRRGVILGCGEIAGHRICGTLSARALAMQSADVGIGGAGGELVRDFFWQQEFFNLGKTTKVNLDRLVRYRFDFLSRPESTLLPTGWYENLLRENLSRLQTIMDLSPNSLNTAKLDAIYLWKVAPIPGRFQAALAPNFRLASPLMVQEFYEYVASLPWKYRLNGAIMRRIITNLCPPLAKVRTWYGGSAEPLSILRPIELFKYNANRAKKLIRKIGQITIHHPIFKDPCIRPADHRIDRAMVGVFQREGLLQADNLKSAGLYEPARLDAFLKEAAQDGFGRYPSFYNLMSIETVCRTCGLTPASRL